MNMMVDTDSILISVKKMLNIYPTDEAFDPDLIMLINGEFMTLHQMGIGPEEGFSITEPDTVWTEYINDKLLLPAVMNYVYMKVRMIFDPPASSVVADAINGRIAELEWRLVHQAEYKQMEADHEAAKAKTAENTE